MRRAFGIGRDSAIAAVAVVAAAWHALPAVAQTPDWSDPRHDVYPAAMPSAAVGSMGILNFGSPIAQPAGHQVAVRPVAPAAPLARVIKNPDASNGSPPYALTDHLGKIQRYVEPVPEIDLDAYIGEVVRVRHDTGRTLLASQLELSPQPLRPLVNSFDDRAWRASMAAGPVTLPRPARHVLRTQYVDNDDSTVELLAEGEERLPDGGESRMMQVEPVTPDASYPGFPDGNPTDCGPMYGEPIDGDAMYGAQPMDMNGMPMDMNGMPMPMGDSMGMPMGGMPMMEGMPGGMPVCPRCGGYCLPPGCTMPEGGPGQVCQCGAPVCRYYANVQINFLRAHLLESFGGGKLSEKYEFSPRVIVGYDGTGHVDGRARYWHYGRNTPFLDGDGAIRVDFDIFDFEATRKIELTRSELLLAAGVRTGKVELVDDDGDSAGNSLLGLTLAADFETFICQLEHGRVTAACSARLSLLGGDWGQDDGHDIIPVRLRDDNVVVDELYAGVGYETCYHKLDLHARLGFEMQNWHSDALSQFAGGDSIGFIGPGVEIGAEF